MPITQSEFNVIKDVVKHVINARKIALSKQLERNSNHDMGRIFDPGTGLRYMLLDIVEQHDGDALFFRNDLQQHNIKVGGTPGTQVTDLGEISQAEVSKYYELFILPKSVKDNLDSFYKDISDSDLDSDDKIKAQQYDFYLDLESEAESDSDSDSESKSSDKTALYEYAYKIVRKFRLGVLNPVFNELVDFYDTEIKNDNPLFKGVGAHEMARYTLSGLLMNTVSLNKEIVMFRTILNKSINHFLNNKLSKEMQERRQAEILILRSPGLKYPLPVMTPRLQHPMPIMAPRLQRPSSVMTPSLQRPLQIITPNLSRNTFLSAKILHDLEELYNNNVKLYAEVRKKRIISFFRDCVGIKQSYTTQWFFSIKKILSSNKSPDEKIAQIIESFNKIDKKEKLIIQLQKRYHAINNFCQKLEEIDHQIKTNPCNPILRRATV